MLRITKANDKIFLQDYQICKSYYSKFVSGLGCSGILNINNEVEALHYLHHAGQLSKDTFHFCFHGVQNHIYESAVGRRINLRGMKVVIRGGRY